MERQTITGRLSTSGRLSGALSVGGGTTDYNELENKPTYNGHIIEGDMTNESLGIWQPFDLIPNTEYDTGIKWNNQTLYCMVLTGTISGNDFSKSVVVNGYVTPITSIWAIDKTDDIQIIDDPNYFTIRIIGGGNNSISAYLHKNDVGAYGSNNPVRVLAFYLKS